MSRVQRDLTAREILDRRFAQGEISRKEYDLMRETIDKIPDSRYNRRAPGRAHGDFGGGSPP